MTSIHTARTIACGAESGLLSSASLIAIYMISQFLRNSIGVIAPDLASELDLSAVEIGLLSSSFFFAFAAVQLPLGIAIDRFGPKACLLVCAAITIVGAVWFAIATSPTSLIVARVLLGIGSCSSFMAPLAIYARRFPPERFATLTGLQLGIRQYRHPVCDRSAGVCDGRRSAGAVAFIAVAVITLAAAVLVALVVTDRSAAAPAPAAPGEPARQHDRRARSLAHAVGRPLVRRASDRVRDLCAGGRACGAGRT